MNFNDTKHIARQQLELLVEEQLDSEQESQLIAHIDQCRDCQERMERLVQNGNEWSTIHHHLVDFGEVETPGESSTRKFLDLLGPTDDPEMLGRLARYEVSAVIGSGSTGIVARAFERTLNRFVAIKVLHPNLCDSAAARKRFDREGRAIAAVVNPHVVPVYAISEHLGQPFIVMQYMPGGSLQQKIARDGPLSSEAVVRFGLHIAEGLEAAHAQGIVHRDVKPANVMLESGSDRAMVSDFGLAQVANEASMTRSGLITGTPQYMSPEQAKGETLDGRSDLFSLGSTLYAACTGHPPFRAENAFGVIKRVCDEQPRSILESNPKIPAWLVAFIEVLMSKRKEERFQTATEVKQHLSAELAHMQAPNTVSCPSRSWHHPATKTKRSTLVVWCAVALLPAVIAAWLVAKPYFEGMQGPEGVAGANQKAQEKQPEELMKAIASLILDEGAPLESFEFDETDSIPVRDGGKLVVRSDLANIAVETHDKPQVDIKAVVSIAARNRKEAAALMSRHQLSCDLEGSDLVKRRDALLVSEWGTVECDLSQFSARAINQFVTKNNQISISRILASNDQSNVSLRIKIPRHFNVEILNRDGNLALPVVEGNIKTVVEDGDITLGDIDGDLNVSLEDGTLLAGDVTGNVVINGEDGDLKLGEIGGTAKITTEDAKIEINKSNGLAVVSLDDGKIQIGKANGGARLTIADDGDIHVSEVLGNIQASTGEGKISVERIGQISSDSSIATNEGAIRIGVESGTSVDIDARSEKGKVRGSLVPEGKMNAADIQLNGGGPSFLLRSKHGSIHLNEVDTKTDGLKNDPEFF